MYFCLTNSNQANLVKEAWTEALRLLQMHVAISPGLPWASLEPHRLDSLKRMRQNATLIANLQNFSVWFCLA